MDYVFKWDEEITACYYCPFCEEDEVESACKLNDKHIKTLKDKPSWCPLKPLNCWGCPKQHE